MESDLVDKILSEKICKSMKTRSGFIGMCSHCSKKMTSESCFNKHIKSQACVSKELRTYCKSCDEVMESRDAYNAHLLTKEHIRKLLCGPVDSLDISVLQGYRPPVIDRHTEIKSKPPPAIPTISERQTKLLAFLKKNEGEEDCNHKFLLILNKLEIDDYKGLGMAIIGCDDMSLKTRQNYLGVIVKYKELLMKKLTSGISIHNGIDINMLLHSLNY